MRRNRIILFVLWVLSVVGISFYGGVASYGFFFILTLIPICSFLYLLCVYATFGIYQKIDTKNPVAGHTVNYFFTFQNGVFFSFAGVKIRFHSAFSSILGLYDDKEYELLPKTRITKETQALCKYRGEYEIGIKYLEMTDYFRLFKLKYVPKETLRVIVKPNIVQLEELRNIDTKRLIARSSFSVPSDPDNEVREYRPGDSLKLIHWNASARERELKVRKLTGEEKQGVSILIDTERFDENMDKYLPSENKILETSIAISLYLAKKNIPSKAYYIANGVKKNNINNIDDFEKFYSDMTQIQFDSEANFSKLVKEAFNNSELLESCGVVFVLHEWNEEARLLAERLSRENIYVSVYLIGEGQTGRIDTSGQRVFVTRLNYDDDLKEVL